MLVFFLGYILLCLLAMRPRRSFNEHYLSLDTSQTVKGIFILLVFFSHFNSYVAFTRSYDLLYRSNVLWFRQSMVTLFLFYSGFGVMQSINKKGIDYLKQFPVKRILSTLFKFICAVLIFWLLQTFIVGQRYTLPTVLLSLIGWDALGNSNWYIFVILVLYLVSFLSFRFLLNKPRLLPLMISFLSVVALITFNCLFKIKPEYWIDTALCYIAGMFWAQYQKPIERFVNKHILIWCALTLLTFITVLVLKRYMRYIALLIILNLCFCLFVVLLSMHITVKSKLLLWCGKHLFELYILQRIPMILLKHFNLDGLNIYLYFILCFIVTLLLVWPFKFITDKIWTGFLSICRKNKQSL